MRNTKGRATIIPFLNPRCLHRPGEQELIMHKRFTKDQQEYIRKLLEEEGEHWYRLHLNNFLYAKGGLDISKHLANRVKESMED